MAFGAGSGCPFWFGGGDIHLLVGVGVIVVVGGADTSGEGEDDRIQTNQTRESRGEKIWVLLVPLIEYCYEYNKNKR